VTTKRILDATASDFKGMGKAELLESVRLAEGRTVDVEVVCTAVPIIGGVTNAELAAAFGADLITLNLYDVLNPIVMGLRKGEMPIPPEYAQLKDFPIGVGVTINEVKELVGRPVGINLEPVPQERITEGYRGRVAAIENAQRAIELGADFLVLTGNPGSGVTGTTILKAIEEIGAAVGDWVILIAGKMHGAGVVGEVVTEAEVGEFAATGADVVLVPAPGTVPGATLEKIKGLVDLVHERGKLALTAIGTSQEGADEDTVRQIALMSKMTGADVHHIGDAGYGGMAIPENIMAFSIAIKGRRHTYHRMALSLRR